MLVGITGGSGFIGQALGNRLKELDVAYKYFEGDILDMDMLATFVSDCDQVVHLAGIFSDDFKKLVEVNMYGTRNVVDACVSSLNVKKIIFSSTGGVYGEPQNGGISLETDEPFPNTLYGLSKWYAEEYLRFSGVPSVVLRFSNVYGPGNRKGVIYNFIRDIREKGTVSVFGTGEQKRNFLFIDDAVEAIVSAIRYPGCAVINVADSEVYSLKDIMRFLKKDCHLEFQEEYHSADVSNKLQVLSEDTGKARELLGWSPKTDIVTGLKKVINEYNNK